MGRGTVTKRTGPMAKEEYMDADEFIGTLFVEALAGESHQIFKLKDCYVRGLDDMNIAEELRLPFEEIFDAIKNKSPGHDTAQEILLRTAARGVVQYWLEVIPDEVQFIDHESEGLQ